MYNKCRNCGLTSQVSAGVKLEINMLLLFDNKLKIMAKSYTILANTGKVCTH